MIFMAATERKEISDAELWKTIPFDEQVWIDAAVDRGDKVEATKRCLCHGKGFTMISAKRVVDKRALELARRHIAKRK
jgi:hypothetical protein